MNEGFKALPEYVQRKIDPEMAKKFAMGGGVMQRPLFRQMGGPAQPMPQDMMQAQPDPQAMVQEAEMAGERVGEQIAAQTMTNIDSATDVKGAIDALRGNAAPLEERYQELAGFVGERDAMQTPESVLALTQPAIMMTEQGAMDSGIGELMQTVAGDSEMSGGMDQGVGALMMQGAGNTPPENFRQGGPVMVRHFQDGTPPEGNRAVPELPELIDFNPFMKRALAAREGILGTEEERAAQLARAQQSAKSDALFNLANFGLAFAGETEGGTVAERLANAARKSGVVQGFQQAGKDVAAARSAQEQQDTSLRLSALESAERSASDAEKFRNELFAMQYKDILEDANVLKANELAVANATTAFGREEALQKARLDAQAALNKANNLLTQSEGELNRSQKLKLQTQAEQAQITLFNLQAMTNLENDLFKMGVKNVYDLDMMDAQTDQSKEIAKYKDGLETAAREDQQAFDAIQKQLDRMERFDLAELEKEVRLEIENKKISESERRRQQDAAQNAINNAFRNDEILQKDRQLNLTEAKNLADKSYNAKKLAIDAAAAKLKQSEIKNKYQLGEYLNSTDDAGKLLVDKFINDEMSAEEANLFETRLLLYTNPSSEFNESTKTYGKVPGLRLSESFNNKLKKRPDLYSAVTGKPIQTLIRGDDELTRNILFDGLTDAEIEKAFGSDSFLKNVVNVGVEALTLGKFGSVWPGVGEAKAAVANLNDAFEKFFMKAAEIRDSVFQGQKLEKLTPNPAAFWTGDDSAAKDARALAARLKQEEDRIFNELNNPNLFLDSSQITEKTGTIKKIQELRSGYLLLAQINALGRTQSGDDGDGDGDDYMSDVMNRLGRIEDAQNMAVGG
tara:strand:- start:725 stop:3289 length:2565 start_codon:yes stop_codon:yes gene_type:complete